MTVYDRIACFDVSLYSDDENASESNTNDRRSRKLRLVSRKSSIVDVAATMWRRVACKYISGAVWC